MGLKNLSREEPSFFLFVPSRRPPICLLSSFYYSLAICLLSLTWEDQTSLGLKCSFQGRY